MKNYSGWCTENVEEAEVKAEGWWCLEWRRLKNSKKTLSSEDSWRGSVLNGVLVRETIKISAEL